KRLTCICQHFNQNSGGKYSVFFQEMTFNSYTTGTLPPENCICLEHSLRNMLESYWFFMTSITVIFSNFIKKMCSRNIPNNRSTKFFVSHKIIVKKNNYFI